MTMEVSKLGIEVTSTGIKEATTALIGSNGNGGLYNAADKVEKKVATMTDTLKKLSGLNVGATMQMWSASMGSTATVAQDLVKQVALLTAKMNEFVDVANRVTSAHNNVARATQRSNEFSGVFTNTLKAMTAAALAYVGIGFVKSIVHAADEFTNLNSKLVVATGSQHNATVVMDQMYEVSQRLRTPLAATTELYGRMAIIMGRYGHDSNDVKTTVTGLAAALHLYGATTGEASSAMLAYAHSASTGVVHMRTLNSLMTSAPLVLRAFQDATGLTGEELRKMSTKGQLSFEMLNKALADATPKFLEQFDHIPMTFQGAMQRIQNAWLYTMGKLGEDTGFNTQLAHAAGVVERLIPTVAQGLGNAFISVMNWVEANRDKLDQIWKQVKGLAADIWDIGMRFGAWAGAVAGAGDQVSVVASGIFGIRLVLALIEDAFTAITGVVAILGSIVYRSLVDPLIQLGTTVMSNLIDAFATVTGLMAKGASFVGLDSLAKSLGEVTDGAKSASLTIQGIGMKSTAVGDSLMQTGKDYLASLEGANSETQKLLNGQKDVADVVQKMTKSKYVENHGDAPPAPPDEHAEAAAKKEEKRYENALQSLKDMVQEQEILNQRLSTYGLEYDKLGPAQKKLIDLQNEMQKIQSSPLENLAKAQEIEHQNILIGIAKQAAAEEMVNEKLKDRLQLMKTENDGLASQLKALQEKAMKSEDKTDNIGKVNGTADNDALKRMQDELALQQAIASSSEFATQAEVDGQNKRVSLLKELVDWQERYNVAHLAQMDKKTQDDFEKLLDPSKARGFGDAMTKAFGSMGKGLQAVVKTMDLYQERTKKVAEAWKLVTAESDPEKKKQMTKEAVEYTTQMQVKSYGDMAEAAQGFFKQGTVGYEMMGAAEKAFRIAEMAMAVENFLEKSGLLTAFTALFATAKAEEVGIEVASVAPHVAAEGMKQGANAITALTSALASPWPQNIAAFAIVGAMLAAIGVGVAGIGGGAGANLSKQRQESQGTGTVLGDSTAKSESIGKSIDALKDTSDIALGVSQGMLASLRNIESALTGVTNAIALGGNSLTGKGFDGSKFSVKDMLGLGSIKDILSLNISGVFSSMVKALGFGTSKSLMDSGITSGNQSVGDVLNGGFQGSAYQDVKSTHHVFGFSTGSSLSRDTQALDPAISSSFTQVIQGMVNTVTQAATALGMDATTVSAEIAKVQVSLGDISLKDLSSEEIQKQLEAVFSAFGDTITTTVLGPTITKFQQAGEGLLQTAVRVAAGVDSADYELEKLGLTAINFSDIINTSGDVGAEIVRQSIEMKEAGTGVGAIVETLQGTASDIAKTYSDLVHVRTSLSQLGIAQDVSVELIRAAGGLDALQSALDDYQKNFFSQSEQNGMALDQLRGQFAALGQTMPTTRQGFRDLVTQLSAGGAAGQDLAAKVLLLSGSFADLTDQYDSQVQDAQSALKDAYDATSSSLTDTISKFQDFTKSLGDFRDSLLTGDLSPLSAQDKYTEQMSQYNDIVARAKAGDQDALSQYQDAANALLTASRDVNASGAQYSSDFQKVLDDTAVLQGSSSSQVSVAQQQLDALNAQVDGLMTVNTSVLSVQQAIDNLTALMAAGITGTDTSPTDTTQGTHASGLANVPFDGYTATLHKDERVLTATQNKEYMDYGRYGGGEALVAEIKGLRQQVQDLRDGQNAQTGAIVGATYDAHERSSTAIVQGQQDCASTASYNERARNTLA